MGRAGKLLIRGVASSKLVNPGLHPRRCHRPPQRGGTPRPWLAWASSCGVGPNGRPPLPRPRAAQQGMPGQRQPTAQMPGQCGPLPPCWGHNGGTIGWPSIRSDQWLASIRSVLAGPASDGWLAQASDQHMAVAGPAARSDQTRVQQPPHSRSDNSCGHASGDRLLSDLGWAEYLSGLPHNFPAMLWA